MTTMYDIDPLELNTRVATELENVEQIKAPSWAGFVKTGTHKVRPPMQRNWWHLRAAAVLISVAKKGPIGVNKLRTKYGGRKRRGYQPAEFRKGSGSILRHVLQQLEEAKLVEQKTIGVHKGRVITGQGQKLLTKASGAQKE